MKFSELEYKCGCGENINIASAVEQGWFNEELMYDAMRCDAEHPWIYIKYRCPECDAELDIDYNPACRCGEVHRYEDADYIDDNLFEFEWEDSKEEE